MGHIKSKQDMAEGLKEYVGERAVVKTKIIPKVGGKVEFRGTDWAAEAGLPSNVIKGSAPLSGLFDIEPHRHSQLQPDIHLTAREAKAMSPMYLSPVAKGPCILAVGENEPDLFHWQSLQYAARLRQHRIRAEYVSMPGDNHFSLTDRLGNARDPLTRALIAQML